MKKGDEVGPWARDKLDRLGKYLAAYTPVMRRQPWCEGYVYVDAFAGPGRYQVRRSAGEAPPAANLFGDVGTLQRQDPEHVEYLNGSPRVALEIAHPFTWYVFVETDPDRVAKLKVLQEECGETRNVLIRRQDCNSYLRERLIANPKVDWGAWRAGVFLDPFGMQVPWETLEGLARTRAIEVFLNFPVGMAIQRLRRHVRWWGRRRPLACEACLDLSYARPVGGS